MESAVARDTSTKPIVLGFSQLGRESAWRLANSTSIRNAAAESGISLVIKNAEQSQTKQFEAVRAREKSWAWLGYWGLVVPRSLAFSLVQIVQIYRGTSSVE